MIVASIIQPSFLPWAGYFEQMARSDIFVYLDDVKFTKQDWRNRNRLKSPNGISYITVPVKNVSKASFLIKDAQVAHQEPWLKKMLNCIQEWYKRAKFFDEIYAPVAEIFQKKHIYLVDLIYDLNEFIREYLQIVVPTYKSSDLSIKNIDKNGRLIEICNKLGADILYDGASAKAFINKELFEKNGIEVIFQNYVYKDYPQIWGDFESHLSILDLIMNCGKNSYQILISSGTADKLNKEKF